MRNKFHFLIINLFLFAFNIFSYDIATLPALNLVDSTECDVMIKLMLEYSPINSSGEVGELLIYVDKDKYINVPDDVNDADLFLSIDSAKLDNNQENKYNTFIEDLEANTQYYVSYTVRLADSDSIISINEFDNSSLFATINTFDIYNSGYNFSYITAAASIQTNSVTLTISSSSPSVRDSAIVFYSATSQPSWNQENPTILDTVALNSSSTTVIKNVTTDHTTTYYFTVFPFHSYDSSICFSTDTSIIYTSGIKVSAAGLLTIGDNSNLVTFALDSSNAVRIQWDNDAVTDSGFLNMNKYSGSSINTNSGDLIPISDIAAFFVIPDPSGTGDMTNNDIKFDSAKSLSVSFILDSMPENLSKYHNNARIYQYSAGSWAKIPCNAQPVTEGSIISGKITSFTDTSYYTIFIDTTAPTISSTSNVSAPISVGGYDTISYTVAIGATDQTSELSSIVVRTRCDSGKCITDTLTSLSLSGPSVLGNKTVVVEVENNSDSLSTPFTQTISVHISDGLNSSKSQWISPINFGSISGPIIRSEVLDTNWHLISFPEISDISGFTIGDFISGLDSNFTDTETDSTKFIHRFFKYTSGNNYQVLTRNDTIERGKSYWIKTRKTLSLKGSGYSDTSSSYTISNLKSNIYTDIANPFSAPVSLSSILASSGLDTSDIKIWYYDYENTDDFGWGSSPLSPSDVLKPWRGYAVKMMSATNTTLTIPHPALTLSSTGSLKFIENNDNWNYKCTITDEGFSFNRTMGVSSQASNSLDDMDHKGPGSPASRSFALINKNLESGTFATEYRKSGEDGYCWSIELQKQSAGTINVKLAPNNVPSTFSGLLVDETNNVSIPIEENSSYSIFLEANEKRVLKFYAGTKEYLSTESTTPLMPSSIYVNCSPNPFNPILNIQYGMPPKVDNQDFSNNISLAIYNIKGRLVKRLIKKRVYAGNHSIIWSGKDNFGRSTPSGSYVLKMSVSNLAGKSIFSASRLVTLIK